MADLRVFNLQGLNLRINPLLIDPGEAIRLVNVDNDPLGGKKKRPGFVSFLDNPDNAKVNTLLYWGDPVVGTYLYRASGSIVYYYNVGVGTATAWSICGNGTIANGAHIGGAVLENTLIIGDGQGSTRHTTNGTSFTNTNLAPIGEYFEQYQQRIFVGGTASTLFFSTTGDATNWSGSGTADSSSIQIPGAGNINGVLKLSDRILANKSDANQFLYDGDTLNDLATKGGLSSPYSYSKVETVGFWLNRNGIYSSNGGIPQLISNPIQRQLYNDDNTGIAGTTFLNAPGAAYRFDYLLSVGSITDDLTKESIANCVLKYDFQLDQWSNYSMAVAPTAMQTMINNAGSTELVFGDDNGNTYLFGGTATSDNGTAIESSLEYVINFGKPDFEKKWNYLHAFFNPGCQAQVRVAIADTFRVSGKNYIPIGDIHDGLGDFRFPRESQSNLLFMKITERSTNSRFRFYGYAVDADVMPHRT
jgi:hypothetical protein